MLGGPQSLYGRSAGGRSRSLNTEVAQSKNLPCGVDTTIELKNVKITSDNNGTFVGRNTPRQMLVLSALVVSFLAQS
jgi:hypothetical protein